MAGEATVRFEGLREFQAALRRTGADMADLNTVHKQTAELVAERAVQLVPVVTGTLRGTIRATGTRREGLIRSGYARVPYAGPIHFGWPRHGIEPKPFLYDALDDRREEVLDVYWERLNTLAARHGLDVDRSGVG